MKTYYFNIKHEHWRNGTTVAMTAGMVRAESRNTPKKLFFKTYHQPIRLI